MMLATGFSATASLLAGTWPSGFAPQATSVTAHTTSVARTLLITSTSGKAPLNILQRSGDCNTARAPRRAQGRAQVTERADVIVTASARCSTVTPRLSGRGGDA